MANLQEIDSFISVIKNGSGTERLAAIEAIAHIKDPRAFEPLVDALRDRYSNVRKAAAEVLGEIRDARAVEPLIVLLEDSDPDVGGSAAEALAAIKDSRASGPLVDTLKHGKLQMRHQAAKSLGKFNDRHTVDLLLEALEDADYYTRVLAARAFGSIMDPHTVPALITALRDPNEHVRLEAATSLGEIQDRRAVEPLIMALKDQHSGRHAALALQNFKDSDTIDKLMDALVTVASCQSLHGEDLRLREMLILALRGARDTRVFNLLVTALNNGSEEAIKALGDSKDPRAVSPLVAAFGHFNQYVRKQIGYALSEIGACYSIDFLIAALEDNKGSVREGAAYTLGLPGMNDPRAVFPVLLRTMKDGNSEARATAIFELSDSDDIRAVDLLIKALQDPDSNVRKAAAQALGKPKWTKDARAIMALLSAAAKDAVYAVRGAADESLRGFKEAQSIDLLIQALEDTDSGIRRVAAGTLGDIKDGRAVTPLITVLKDDNSSVRASVAEALGNINDARAVAALITACHDQHSEVSQAAVRAVANIKGHLSAYRLIADLLGRDLWRHEKVVVETDLRRMLESSAASIDSDALVLITQLRDELWSAGPGIMAEGMDYSAVSTSQIKQLASQELLRRGAGM